jgi:hypothetical protein
MIIAQHDRVPVMARDAARRWLRIGGMALGVLSLALLVVSTSRDATRCRDVCFGPAAKSRYGSQTYEPGHHWTAYADSWQWGAQNALVHVALVGAFLGVGLAAFRRNPIAAYAVAVLALAAWGLWPPLSPPMT